MSISRPTSSVIAGLVGGLVGAALYHHLVAKPVTRKISTKKASPAGGHYSQAVVANGIVTISGLLPITPDGVKLADKSFAEQVKCVFANLDAILEAAGTNKTKLVNCRVYVSNIDSWGEFNNLYADYLQETRPARCVVPVPHLHYGLQLELEAAATVC